MGHSQRFNVGLLKSVKGEVKARETDLITPRGKYNL